MRDTKMLKTREIPRPETIDCFVAEILQSISTMAQQMGRPLSRRNLYAALGKLSTGLDLEDVDLQREGLQEAYDICVRMAQEDDRLGYRPLWRGLAIDMHILTWIYV